jgi:non-heme chloroperoxidase
VVAPISGIDSEAPVLRPSAVAGHGLTLMADAGGPADAPCVVLLPGAGQTRRAWGGAAARLVAAGYQVLSLDLRGHGDSGWASDGDYGIDAFIADLRAVLDTLTVPVVLVGASIGGIAALMTAAGAPHHPVAGLVLVDVVPQMESAGLQRIRAFMSAHGHGFASLQEAADTVAAFLPHRPRPSRHDGLLNSLRTGADGRLYWHWDPAFHAGSAGRQGMFERMEAAAARLTTPTLLISGQRSEVVSRAGARQLLAVMPQATWVDIEDASHMVAGDSNDRFNAALAHFIQSVLPLPRHAP